MRTYLVLLLGLLIVGSAFGQAVPPINLQAELLQGGNVSLTWDPPPDGLVEDFEDGLAQDFDWFAPGGTYVIEDGYAKIDMTTGSDWGSGVYTGVTFDNLTVSTTFEYVEGQLSRGLLFRADGPKDSDYTGYGYWIAHTLDAYSLWKYNNGAITNVVPWTDSALINDGVGAINTLTLTADGSTFDMYINGTYVSSVTDASHASGYVGIVSAYDNEVWYDDITGLFGIVPPGTDNVEIGTPIAGNYDDLGRPTDQVYTPSGTVFNKYEQGWSSSNEIDEFVEYRVYLDGDYVGSTTTESFDDTLPSLGEHTYTVTAFYDPEGESSPAGPVLVNWEPVVLTLTGQVTTVPPEGGMIFYDVSIWNTLPQSFPNVNWWTEVELPNGQLFGPLMTRTVTIPGFLDITVQAMNQDIPSLAPGGEYIFYGHLGHYPTSLLMDSFTFTKEGVATDNIEFDPEHWAAGGEFSIAADGETVVSQPSTYALSSAWPNPFNPSTSFSVSLPDAADLTVTVYNIAGQRVATLADGMTSAGQHQYTFDAHGLASGLYFVQAVVPGQLNEIRKVTLLR